MIGELLSIFPEPQRNAKLVITQREVFSGISEPAGSIDPRTIDHYELSGFGEEAQGLVSLGFVLTGGRRVRFYRTYSKLDMALLLDQLDGTIGQKPKDPAPTDHP